MLTKKRQLNVYEKNHLRKFGFKFDQLGQFKQMPVEYITGRACFASHTFIVNKNVLIPRVETEELIDLAVQELTEKQAKKSLVQTVNIIDVGTGSGCIGISLAHSLKALNINYKLSMTDVSTRALNVAKKNWQRLCPDLTAQFIESNLLESVPPQKFNLIVANLPYLPQSTLNGLDISVKDYEPILALDGGQDGLELINCLIEQAQSYLAKNGIIILELDPSQNLANFANQYMIKLINDQFDRQRFAVLQLREE